jgi:hypothetical protein
MPIKLNDNYDLSRYVIILTGATDGKSTYNITASKNSITYILYYLRYR